METLETRFASRGVKGGGLLLFRAPDALAFLEQARAERVPVLGIETFILTGESIQPQMDQILDLSDAGDSCDTWSEARVFVAERASSHYVFEVTV